MKPEPRPVHAAMAFIRATVIGGLVFLLPFGVILVVLGKLYSVTKPLGRQIHETLFPYSASVFWPIVFAVLILVGLAFLAGIFARSTLGRRMFARLETTFLDRLPPYAILRQMIQDFSDSGNNLAVAGSNTVVTVHFDDYSCIAFLIERREPGKAVIFLPGAPSATSGSVALVDIHRIEETDLTPLDVMRSMRRLGIGLERRPTNG